MRHDIGWLPAIALCTLIWSFFVWAAMHDLARGDEGTLEWIVLAICAVAFPLLFRSAVRTLAPHAKVAWLIGAGLLLGLFSAGAVRALTHPKYHKDPMLASIFLLAGVPALALIGYHLVRDCAMAASRLSARHERSARTPK